MPEGFEVLTKVQQSSFIKSFLYHLAALEDIEGWDPKLVEPSGQEEVIVYFDNDTKYLYCQGDYKQAFDIGGLNDKRMG